MNVAPQIVHTISIGNIGTPNKNGNYYTTSINKKQSIMAFSNKKAVTDCTYFLAHYKNKFNRFPSINEKETVQVEYSKYHLIEKYSVMDILSTEIFVNDDDISELVDKCGFANLGLLVVNSFGFVDHNSRIDISFKAQDVEIPKRILSLQDLEGMLEL